jgi:pSer/pThr/pTyr-binding forkhead associated (FHA) protein
MGDDCCGACARWGEREAEPIERAELQAPRGLALVVRGTGEVVEISAERPIVRVGRVADNDLVLRSGAISKRQMRFLFIDGAVYAEDLKSTCGTFVDGRKITQRTRLGRGAVVSFADFDVELVER